MAAETSGPIKKSSLFKKQPLFKKTTTITTDDPYVLFSRADSSSRAIIEATEKRIAKRRAKEAKRKEEVRKQEANGAIPQKRRRVSISSSSSSEDEDEQESRRRSETASTPISPLAPKKIERAALSTEHDITKQSPSAAVVVDLSDEDTQKDIQNFTAEEQDGSFVSTSSKPSDAPVFSPAAVSDDEEDEPESDEELAAIARQAKEKARKKQELEVCCKTGSPSVVEELVLVKEELPSFNLRVQSELPLTTTQTFRMRLDTQLRRPRYIWCTQNGFESRPSTAGGTLDEIHCDEIVLMFRGRRVYDVNTPASLGISIDAIEGPLVDRENPLDLGYEDGIITVDAIKQSQIDIYIADWHKKQGRVPIMDEEEDVSEVRSPSPPKERSIKIICRAKDQRDFKLLVKSSTTIGSIQNAYIKEYDLDGTNITIFIDGEAQDPDLTMQALEVDDMDVLDIHIAPFA